MSSIGGGGGVNSVQSGQATTAGGVVNVTISAVDTAKSICFVGWHHATYPARARLTSSTNLELYSTGSGQITNWQVVEFK